jgi:hypothetical protein
VEVAAEVELLEAVEPEAVVALLLLLITFQLLPDLQFLW